MEGQENKQGKPEELRFAYDQVRKEIVASDDLALKIVGGTIALTGAIMGFASSQAVPDEFVKGILCFVAAATSLIGLYQILNQDRATYILGNYLRIFLEPQMPYMKWETRLYELREQTPVRIGYGNFIWHHMLICTVLSGAAFFLGSWFLLKSFNLFNISKEIRESLVGLIIGVVFATMLCFGIYAWCIYKKQRKEIECEWIKIKISNADSNKNLSFKKKK